MDYTRELKYGMTGDDVRAVKDKLYLYGFLKKQPTHNLFGVDTRAAVKDFQLFKTIKPVTGTVNELTWNELMKEEPKPVWTRELKVGMSGTDVRAVKDKLVELGYLDKSTHNKFGTDTKRAVMEFQDDHAMGVSGTVDKTTWDAIFSAEPEPPKPGPEIPSHISSAKAKLISAELAEVSETRQNMVLEALQYAVDPDNHGEYPRAFYIRGGNFYDNATDLHVMTLKRLTAYFNKEAYAPYYDGGRKEMMLEAAEASGYTIPGADCSGFIVGIWRHFKYKAATFDANANWLYKSGCTDTDDPVPGDLCWKDGHIGMYVGAGYAVESAGGAYGIQLTVVKKRKVWNFVKKALQSLGTWTAFGKPKGLK